MKLERGEFTLPLFQVIVPEGMKKRQSLVRKPQTPTTFLVFNVDVRWNEK